MGNTQKGNQKKKQPSISAFAKKLEEKKNTQDDQKQSLFHNCTLQMAMDATSTFAPQSQIPLILTTLCTKVRELNGFETEGIFRISAPRQELERYKTRLSNGDYMIDTQDPNIPACLLKEWLRGLNDSFIPQSHYDAAVQMAKNNEVKQEALETLLSELPDLNARCIKYLVEFLQELTDQKHVAKTKMSIENVAIVFAPVMLKCPHNDPKVMLMNSKSEKDFLIALIQELNNN